MTIIGASGHGKVVADIAVLNGYTDIVFLDNNPAPKECTWYPVIRPDTMTAQLVISATYLLAPICPVR